MGRASRFGTTAPPVKSRARQREEATVPPPRRVRAFREAVKGTTIDLHIRTYDHPVVKVNQVWASTMAGDVARGRHQACQVMEVDKTHAHLLRGDRVVRIKHTTKGLTGHKKV